MANINAVKANAYKNQVMADFVLYSRKQEK